jgi:hypothetical protein
MAIMAAIASGAEALLTVSNILASFGPWM